MISVIRPPVIVPWSLIHSIFILGKIAQLLWAFHFGLLIGLKETKNVNFLEECLAPGNQSLVAIVILAIFMMFIGVYSALMLSLVILISIADLFLLKYYHPGCFLFHIY